MENSENILRENLNNYLACLEHEFKNLMDRTEMYITGDKPGELYTYSYSLFVNYVTIKGIIQSKDIIGSFGITNLGSYPQNNFDPQSVVKDAIFRSIKINIKNTTPNAFLASISNIYTLDRFKNTNVLQTAFKFIINPEIMILE